MLHTYYLAIDIGASSGRHILAWLEGGKIRLEEIHRFENGPREFAGQLVWDVGFLQREITAGLRLCYDSNRVPSSIGIDTWGVDFVLLDSSDSVLGNAVSYRDKRTAGMMQYAHGIVSDSEMYSRIGIQSHVYNSLYQLLAIQQDQETLARAHSFLMLPDYLNFLLTGNKCNEYTNATTTQRLNPATRDWDWELIARFGLPDRIFSTPKMPGALVGKLRPEVVKSINFDSKVLLCCSHDTASAILSLPDNMENVVYLNSGTLSLIGIEAKQPDCREECRLHGFANEGGYDGKITFLKNIMGMWIIQNIAKEMGLAGKYGEIQRAAEENLDFESYFDVNAEAFLAPSSMIEAIKKYCLDNQQPIPDTDGKVLAAAYKSLAKSYAVAIQGIEEITGRVFDRLQIMGGECQDNVLNRLTARYTKKTVQAGPVEATALGNILVQMMHNGEFSSLEEARNTVRDSFNVKTIDL